MRAFALTVVLTLFGGTQFAQSQTEPPDARIYTDPVNVRPNQPFTILVDAMAPAAAIGIWDIDFDAESHVITLFFDTGCGFICPGDGTPFPRTFDVAMPGLAEGNYLIRLLGDPPVELRLTITATPIALPFTSPFSLGLLIAAIFAAAITRLLHPKNGTTAHHG